MTEQELSDKLIEMQANITLNLVDFIMQRCPDLTEDELRFLSFAKSGAYNALGMGAQS